MTRKQAVRLILSYLDSRQDLPDELYKAKNILQETHENMAWKIWNDKTIREAIDRFIKENGRPPNTRDLAECEYLPPVPSVKQAFKMPVAKWLRENYPNNGIDRWQYRGRDVSNEQLLEWFKSEYKRIQPKTNQEFIKKRGEGTPSWRYVAKRHNINSWRELIEFAQLETYQKEKEEKIFQVHSNFVYENSAGRQVLRLH